MKNVNVTRVNREDVPATVRYVSEISGVALTDMHLLGSTGKNQTSGDVDLGISVIKYNPENLHQRMLTTLGNQRATFNRGNNVGSYAVAIAGDPNNGLVQVDFMYVMNPEWAEFAYFSAGERSKYKGVIRTVLLRSVASSLDEHGTDLLAYDTQTGDLMIRVGRTFDLNVGLRRIVQYRPARKDGKGFLKVMKTVTMDELEATFPALNFGTLQTVAVVDKPTDALKIMFGFDVQPTEVETAEQVVTLIHKLPMERRERIMAKARETFVVEKGYLTEEQVNQLFQEIVV